MTARHVCEHTYSVTIGKEHDLVNGVVLQQISLDIGVRKLQHRVDGLSKDVTGG